MIMVAATANSGKLEEIRRILSPLGFDVKSPAELGVDADVEETGITFAENARIKAQALWDATGEAVVADDSGLCIDALDGAPGVLSARYLGHDTPQEKKNAAMLRELEAVPAQQRTARFVAAVCCILKDGTVIECEHACEGAIGYEPLGDGGFGYDPIFMVGERSFAQFSAEEKDAISHRGGALRKLYSIIKNRLDLDGNSI